MAKERVQRRLAAILAADVVGYSRLMGQDETGTLTALKQHRAALIDPTIAEHRGRIVKLMGDGVLVEFASVVDAVECAVSIQRSMVERNVDTPDSKRITFRIGVNLGDIIIDDDDIYGDGVNVAARLEGLADPDGICISGTVFDQVKDKLDVSFDDLGSREVKNIADPVRAYRVALDRASVTHSTAPLPLPDKPSIAVLPFDNMSGDPEQEHFADGITEDLITALSRIRSFFVIARNTTFTYKGRAVDVAKVSRELGVRYVLEGSVRRSGDRIRITAQLIDGTTGNHVWAERYDRDLTDIFDLQDEISQTIAAAIEPELSNAERERALRQPPDNLGAWESYQRGMWHLYRFTEEDTRGALQLFRRAIDGDPRFAPAHVGQSFAHFTNIFLGWTGDREQEIEDTWMAAQAAVACDDKDAAAHWVMGRAFMLRCEFDQSIAELRQAIGINPSYAHAYYNLGWTLALVGKAEDSLVNLERADRLSPHDPLLFAIWGTRSFSLQQLERYDEALTWVEKASRQPNAHEHLFAALAYSFVLCDRTAEAQEVAREILRKTPTYRIQLYAQAFPFQNQTFMATILEAMEKAGLPA